MELIHGLHVKNLPGDIYGGMVAAVVALPLALTRVDGEDTLAEVKRVVPMLPGVIMSHLVTPALARRLCDRGMQSFLVKPVRRDQLAVTLFRHLL